MPDNAYSEKETGWKETKIWIQELVVWLCEKTGDLAIRPSLQQCSCIIAIEHKAAQEWQEYCRHICAQASQEHIWAQALSRTRRDIQPRSVKVHRTSSCSAAIPMDGISTLEASNIFEDVQQIVNFYSCFFNVMKSQHAKSINSEKKSRDIFDKSVRFEINT